VSNTKIIYLHALTPVHSGTGQAAAVIDLPIAREKATGYPMIPSTSLKGVWRDTKVGMKVDKNLINIAFGCSKEQSEDGTERAGAYCFTDQRILCLPVRSYYGTFAYVTSPLTLKRLYRDAKALGASVDFLENVPDPADPLNVLVASGSPLAQNNAVYLEDLDLSAPSGDSTKTIADGLAGLLFPDDPKSFTERFALVSDEMFSYLCETATEIAARIVLDDEKKTTKNLWYEEAVPAESVFYGFALLQEWGGVDLNALSGVLNDVQTIQIGGNASVGRGLCRVVVK
jgi:CRISPR-associated protein Cmr4